MLCICSSVLPIYVQWKNFSLLSSFCYVCVAKKRVCFFLVMVIIPPQGCETGLFVRLCALAQLQRVASLGVVTLTSPSGLTWYYESLGSVPSVLLKLLQASYNGF